MVRRLVLGERRPPYDVVAGLASTLEQADEGPEQLAAVADAVASAFGVGYVRVEVDRPAGERLVATHGDRAGRDPHPADHLPRTRRSAGWCCPRAGCAAGCRRRDEQLLGDLVRQAATAARTSQLADELQDSRERLVVAREEERRRIRRDLHDGLGPSLSGVVFQLESARLLVDRDPDAAKRTIAATSGHVQDVVADVRRLVHDLRPPALDDRGLVGALRQQAERITASGGPTVRSRPTTSAPCRPRSRSRRTASPARRSPTSPGTPSATTATVRLVRDDRDLLVEVADDGGGIAAGGPGRRRPGLAARARRRARRPQRGHLPGHRRDRGPRLAAARTTTPKGTAMSWDRRIRVVVVDDHQIVRDGLVALLGALDGIEVVGTAADGKRRAARGRRDRARTWWSWTSRCPSSTASRPPGSSPAGSRRRGSSCSP